ncbi:MAG: tetratricopeptide repeat protein [Bacteroidetes bacterium]|nr:tetratricopeptide repeat protein [Bacteroidota bacterium]
MIRLFAITVFLFLPIDIGKISKINAIKKEAKKAFENGDYETASSKYRYLMDSLNVQEDEVLLNLASSRFNLNDTIGASDAYRRLTASGNPTYRGRAYQQLGVMETRQGRLEQALEFFKQALKTDPANEEARYNYEMVKKKLEEEKKKQENKQNDQKKDDQQDQQNQDKKDQQQKKNQNQNQNKDQNKKDQEKKENEKKDSEKKDQDQKEKEKKEQQEQKENQDKKEEKPKFDPDKMKQMKVSEEKAKMILEAMKSNEVQYLQQNRRKATKPKDKSKPDW